MEELAHEDAQKYMGYWNERAVDEQRKELRTIRRSSKLKNLCK
jgi:hypothetical protein